MSIRYPNGKAYIPKQNDRNKVSKKNSISYGNRGMSLEEDINISNEYYLAKGIAVIHKKPTPLQIVKVDYPKRSAAVIKEAYFQQASTTDYNGVFKGKYIDFEAKETKNKTSFPLKNFHKHQIEHMGQVLSQQGICFALLRFSTIDEVYLLDAEHLCSFWYKQEHDRKSIPKSEIEALGHAIGNGLYPRIDYLSVVENIYFVH
ncbi:Holliday junction resolvase RecU [Anaerobacillus arseniciselenatis]|uniref:Holliday junction resolvase RecU n=1 Tax=Anaerobacillus arseniciselenatis TaxID=85682 RepID=A0A1S2LVX0_9BACI|nr:Holliday junction resolvase RecU [Anaerobacillus arseniciselenatis]OIJ15807.1 Holliday junction resolvase RecU [Anaerobacillus arseniciselenatis]